MKCIARWAAALIAVLAGCGPSSQPSTSNPPAPTAETSVQPAPSPPPPSPAPPSPSFPPVTDAAGAGAALAAAEAAIRTPTTPAGQLAAWGRTQQLAYRALSANPAWSEEALAQLPPELLPAARANIEAGAELRALTRPREALPPWMIVEPPPAQELLGYYKQAGAEFGIPWPYLAAIHLVESRMGRIRGTSSAGAQGPMQFLPSTWAAYGEGDINSPSDSIRGAARYLEATGAPGDMAGALFAYNRSNRYVRAITLYAQQMIAEERAYFGYYNWQVFYRLTTGDVELAVGYGS
ncbi:MAG: transglycosylase SLT domain-containing protein [Actinomycetota bacterium]